MLYEVITNMGMMLVLGVVFMLYLVPLQMKVMTQRGIDLPKITLVLAEISVWLSQSGTGWLIIATIAAIIWYNRKSINRWEPWDRRKLDIPFFGKFYTLVRLHKLCQQLASMQACGVPESTAYDIIKDIAVNVRIKAFFRGVGKSIQDGKSYTLSYFESADHVGLVGFYMATMMKIADQTGAPVVVLDDICGDWKSEIDYMTTIIPETVNMVMTIAYLVMGAAMMILIWLPYVLGMEGLQEKFNARNNFV